LSPKTKEETIIMNLYLILENKALIRNELNIMYNDITITILYRPKLRFPLYFYTKLNSHKTSRAI
jgi:hypothetical protein